MNRRLQTTTHMVLIITLLFSHLFSFLNTPAIATAVETGAIVHSPDSAALADPFDVITTINTDWGLPIGDGTCQILWIPPIDETIIEINNMRDVSSRLIFDAYYWRHADGAQIKFYQNVDHPDQVWINIAGSTVNYPGFGSLVIFNDDINDLFENGESQDSIHSDYAKMTRAVIQYAIDRISLTNKRLVITGHSQGGNVGQLVMLETFLNDPAMQAAYPDAFAANSVTVFNDNGSTYTLKSSFPEELLGEDFGEALVNANNTIDGGIFIASRPHWLVHKINGLKQPDQFGVFVTEETDAVPVLFTPKTAFEYANFYKRVGVYTDGLVHIISLVMDLVVFDKFGMSTSDANIQSRELAVERSQIVFDDLKRANYRAHGQSYIDSTLSEGQNTKVIKGVLPAEASIADYSPPNTTNGTLRLKPLGGGGFDCRSSKVYIEEIGAERPLWHIENCKLIIEPLPNSTIRKYEADRNSPLRKPDGIPDVMWVDPQVLVDPDAPSVEINSDGTTLDPRYDEKQRSVVHYWTDTYGAPDGPSDRNPFSDLRERPLEEKQRNLGEYGIFDEIFGVIYNREFIVNIVTENGKPIALEEIVPGDDCDSIDPPGDDDDDDRPRNPPEKRYPFGHPDDYQAPWTFEDASAIPNWDLDTQYLDSIIPTTNLEPWGSAWSQAVVNALHPRIQQAQALNLPAAETYYQYLQALINYQEHSVASTTILNSIDLSAEYEAARIQLSSLTLQLQAEWSTGTRNGQAASADEILDYWESQIINDPAISTWRSRPEAQAWQAAAEPYIAARETFMQRREAAGGIRPFQHQIYVERIKVERAINNLLGIGILEGGLDTWTNATLTFSGITAKMINPLQVSPEQVPPVLIVPTGAFEYYQQFSWSRTWLEQYTEQGGTLVVLAQAFGRDWELLPGGEVRGLGFEEDILCREASVDLLSIKPYLAGIRRDRPDLQLDGSFTHYPSGTEVILNRRTGNQMPAMIEYQYGLGKVVATSLYADFAVINGMQTGDDLPFARSFFLYWWAEATGTPRTTQVPIGDAFDIDVNVVNTGSSPLDKVLVTTDVSLDGPDSWRYQAHYNDWKDYPNAAEQLVEVALEPPLNPGEQRTLAVAMPGVHESGFHRIGVNGNPDSLYLVESPFGYESLVKLAIKRNQDTYWPGDQLQFTLQLTPTPQLLSNTTIQISEQHGFFTNRNVTVQPGQVSTITINIPVENKHLNTPFVINVREANTGNLQGVYNIVLPPGAPPVLKLVAPTTATTNIPLTVTNIGVHGTTFSGTLRLVDSDGYLLLTQPISGVVGHTKRPDSIPATQHFSIALPGNQAADKYSLSYHLADPSGTTWRGVLDVELPGLAAELETEVELPVYDPTQTVTTTTWLTANMSVDDAWLNLIVKKPFADVSYKLLAGGLQGSDGQGRDAHFYDPKGIALSNDGSYALVLDGGNALIRRVDMQTGVVRTLAGNTKLYWNTKFTDGVGSHAELAYPRAIDLSPDESFALFIDDYTVRRFDLASRRVTTIAGEPVIYCPNTCSDNILIDGIGSSARFINPNDIKISNDGTFALVADSYAIRHIDLQTYEVSTIAGGTAPYESGLTYNDGIGLDAQFGHQTYLAIAHDNQTAYIVDSNINVIRKVNLQTREVTTIVGQKQSGSTYADGIGVDARLPSPYYIDIDSSGVYAYFTDYYKATLRRLDLQTLEVTTISGDPNVSYPCSVANQPEANGYICDPGGLSIADDNASIGFTGTSSSMINRIDLASMSISTLAGERWAGANGIDRFNNIGDVAWMPNERSALILADNILWQIDTQGAQQTLLAGAYEPTNPCQDVDGVGATARFCNPEGLAISPDATFALITDTDNKTIRRYDISTREVTTVAGSGACTSATIVDGIGSAAELCNIRNIKMSSDGSYALFLDGIANPRYIDAVRKLDLQTFEVTTIMSDVTTPELDYPYGLALDPADQYAIIAMPYSSQFLSLDLTTYATTLLTPTGNLADFTDEYGYYDEHLVIYEPEAIDISADGTFAIFIDSRGLKRWDLISNTVYWLDKNFDSYEGNLALSSDGSRALFANNNGINYGNYGAALQVVELAATLYDKWIPLSGTGSQTITNPLVDPVLSSDPRARGPLVLEASLYGPQRTDAITNQRQLITKDFDYFVITPDTYTLTLVPEPSEVRLGEPASLSGVVRNISGQTGVTLAISVNGVALPDVVLPDVAPGQVAAFKIPVNTNTAGFYTYRVAAPDDSTASAEIGIFAPGILVDPFIGDTLVNVNGTASFTTTIYNQSLLEGSVTIQFGDTGATTFDLPGNTAISATFTLDIPETAPRFWTVPVTLSGDLQEQRFVDLEVLFTGPAEFSIENVMFGTPVVGQVFTASLDPNLAPLAIPDDGERSLNIPTMIMQTGVVSDINVQVSLVHSYTSDLEISLVAPNGEEIILLHNGYSSGENFLETTFDDQASMTIYDGSAPYTGSFKPYQPLAALDGASLTGEWQLKVKDTSANSYGGWLLDWKLIITPQAVDTTTPVVAGQALRILTTLQPTKRGITTLHVNGLEGVGQQPLAVTTFDPVVVSTLVTVPTTLPGGEYPLYIQIDDTQLEIPVTVRNWEAELDIALPVSSVQIGEVFTPSITITETAGISGTPTLYVRYGTSVVTQQITLAPNAVQTIEVPLAADYKARRVSVSLANVADNTQDPPFVALIDSRPINVLRFNAHVALDSLQATSGSTLTGRLIIDDPVSYVRLRQPLALGGDLLWLATGVSNTVVLHERDQMIDLAVTPTGTWEFAFAIPEDLPSGRYALPFEIDGREQPVMLDVVGPHVTIHQTDLAGSSDLLSITLDVESTTAVSVTPRLFYRGSELSALSTSELLLQSGFQTVELTTYIPEWLRGVGELAIVFDSRNGRPLGGTQVSYQSQSIAILQADLVGPTIAEPVTVSTTLLGSGPVTLTASTSAGTLITESLTLNGYQNHSFTLLLPASTEELTVTVTDSSGQYDAWPLNVGLLVEDSGDSVPPMVSLNPISGSFAATWTTLVTVTGTASDDIALAEVRVGTTLAQIEPATGAFTAVVQLRPGTHSLRATAQDAGGNLAESADVSVEVAFIPPTLNVSAPTTVQEGSILSLTVTLNTPSALSGTVRISSTGGSATAGDDYAAVDDVLSFASGQTTQTLTLSIPLDAVREDPETVIFTLSEPYNLELTTTTLTVTIEDQTVSTDHRLYLPLVRRTP